MKPQHAHRWGRAAGSVSRAATLCIVMAALFCFFSNPAAARRKKGDGPSPYAEVPVSVRVQGIGLVELPALILEEKGEVYLPVSYLFEFLKIKHTVSADLDTLEGRLGASLPHFVINAKTAMIWNGQQSIALSPDDITITDLGMFLRAPVLGEALGLNCAFNFRSLSITITTKHELPAIREARLLASRQQITQKGATGIPVDTSIARPRPMFSLGAVDWMVTAAQRAWDTVSLRGQLTLGLTALGGETILGLNWSQNESFDPRRQYYLWRWVDNERRGLRQVAIGKVFTPMTSSLYSPLIGVQVTNTPTTQRTSFSTYKLANTTKPGWTVELYVNNVLLDFVKADTSGYYSFDIPLTYGTSDVKLRFYGPYGEESFREEVITVPFNFLPQGELEYSVSAGVVEDTSLWQREARGSDGMPVRFGRASAAYGVSRGMTANAGVEYLSSVSSGPVMPFVGASARLTQRLLFSGEYALGARAKGLLSYRLPKNILLELAYWKYDAGQTAILTHYRERRNVSLVVPVRGTNFSLFSRSVYNVLTLPTMQMHTAEWMLTGHFLGINANLSSFASFAQETQSLAYSNLALTFRCPKGYLLTPQVQYEYLSKEIMSAKCLLEKSVFRRGFLNISYERNFRQGLGNLGFGFRYDFRFAQVSYASTQSNGDVASVHTLMARGGAHIDARTRNVTFTNRTAVGRAGLTVVAFLDLNCNGIRDEGEPRAANFKFRGSGGRIVHDAKDTVTRIYDLEPYTDYLIYPDAGAFENIAWTVKQKAIGVQVSPNQMTEVSVPVAVVGEVSGLVYTADVKGKRKGRARIAVCLQNEDGVTVARTVSETDGYFSFMGLKPGVYRASVETVQLKKLALTATPEKQEVRLLPKMEGDIVSGVNFCLRAMEENEKGGECP